MEKLLFYIAGGKMFCLEGGREREIPSGVLQKVIHRIKEQAKRKEWKQTGSGAAFLGEAQSESVESQLANLRASVNCLGFRDGRFIYSLRVGETSGIYSKRSFGDTDEGIVLSDSEYRYSDFDVAPNGDMIITATFAGEAHLALLRGDERSATVITEGDSLEVTPVWSKTKADTVYFSSAGLLQNQIADENDPRRRQPVGFADIMASMMMTDGNVYREQSAFALSEMNIRTGEIKELLSDPKYSFVRPQCDDAGNLYYIKKPFAPEEGQKKSGCLVDLLLAPFRLIRAIIGFFNLFTIKYSGKNLTTSGGASKARQKDAEKIFLDGNLIAAEKEREANKNSGEAYPGIIPRSYELHCLSPDGRDTLVRKGVLAYRLDGDELIYSNGSYLIRIHPDKSEEKLVSADKAVYLMV